TNLGLLLSAYGVMSSASSTPVRSRDTFSTRAVTMVGWPAGTRGGSSLRAQDSRYRDRRAISADTSGRMTSSAPTRTRSGSGIARPHTMAAPPAATNDRPRVVSEPNTPRMAYLLAPRPGLTAAAGGAGRRSGLPPARAGAAPRWPPRWAAAGARAPAGPAAARRRGARSRPR